MGCDDSWLNSKHYWEVIIQYISNMEKMVQVNEPNILVYYTLPEQTVTTTAEHDNPRNQYDGDLMEKYFKKHHQDPC